MYIYIALSFINFLPPFTFYIFSILSLSLSNSFHSPFSFTLLSIYFLFPFSLPLFSPFSPLTLLSIHFLSPFFILYLFISYSFSLFFQFTFFILSLFPFVMFDCYVEIVELILINFIVDLISHNFVVSFFSY